MDWSPEDISQEELHRLRDAAERAWSDETRHEHYLGHPQPSAGQCYVTSRWLTKRLGGYVGVKGGHYFWVSPDKTHIIDLTGDQFSYSPVELPEGLRLDPEDEGWTPTEDQQRWSPGPVVFKPANHPLYTGLRVKQFKTEAPRVKLFADRADAAYENPDDYPKVAFSGWGGDAYPGEESQYADDQDYRYMHDEPDYEPGSGEYNFFYGNGQLHVSPTHSHDELRGHARVPGDHIGPIAAGRVSLDRGRATWSGTSNIALRGLHRIFKDYTRQVGWRWGGLTTIDGEPISDDFAPKKSMILRNNETGSTSRYYVQGSTVHAENLENEELEALREWADQEALTIVADYPGGTDMNDRLRNESPAGEDLELDNLGNIDAPPPSAQDVGNDPPGTFRCKACGRLFGDYYTYLKHVQAEEPEGDRFPDEEREDGKFPELDMDKVLPPHFHDRKPVVMPLASYREAARVDGFDLYSGIWGFDTDYETVHYAAYLNGEPVGYASIRASIGSREGELLFVQSVRPGRGIGTALIEAAQLDYDSLHTAIGSTAGKRLISKTGFVNTGGHIWKWAQGKQPKDMIDAPVPFIYDIDKDKIVVGPPGTRTSDIPGPFTPGGIIEGHYEPGGKVILTSLTDRPYTLNHLVQLWYWSYPHMEVTNVERLDASGNKTKLAAQNVGDYIRTLALADPAVWNAYQALRKAGGQVYAVGGAVRDALLQKDPKDIDLLVSGVPTEAVRNTLEGLPGRVDLTGKDFGVFRYRTKGHEVEIALPRTERSTGDRRVHFDVQVDHELPVEKDLERRDFTANSMAIDLDSGQLVDPYGGAKDIESGRLSTTHPNSFQEDPTRLLRALVASSRHGLVPDEKTRQEMSEHAPRLDLEARERVQAELDKLFQSNNPAGALRLARDTGLLAHIFPELDEHFDYDQGNPHHKYTLGDHSLNVLDHITQATSDPDLRLAALFHDIGKPSSAWTDPSGVAHFYRAPDGKGDDHENVGATLTEQRLRALNYPVARIRRVSDLVQHHMYPDFSSPKGARKFLQRVGDYADDLMTLRQADREGKGTDLYQERKTPVETQRGLVEQVRSAQQPTQLSALSINGNDLINLGLPPGPTLGRILRLLTDDVVENPALNDRARLLERAQEYINSLPEVRQSASRSLEEVFA